MGILLAVFSFLSIFDALNNEKMKRVFIEKRVVLGLFLGIVFLSACRPSYEVTGVEGGRIEINSLYDQNPDPQAVAILAPYKAKIDSIMMPVIGVSEANMSAYRPESPLSSFAADVLRETAVNYINKPADVAVMNIGGLRNELIKGNITIGDIYEIFPFENSLCILTMRGSSLEKLFSQIALVGGEGISGAHLTGTRDGKLLDAKVDGKEIVPDKLYNVVTLDYLAEGNDGMTAFLEATTKVCPEGVTIRQIMIDYVKELTKQGKVVTFPKDKRTTVK